MASSIAARAARFLRSSRAATAAACTLTAFLLAGCGGDALGPAPETVTIRLEVTGGFAGVDYAIEVDGAAGVVIGVRCLSGCDFDSGEVIVALSGFQITDVARELEDAGVFGYDRREFGVECCDQFDYRLVYERNLRESELTGSSGTLPDPIGRVIERLHSLAAGRIPAIVDFTSAPGAWPADALSLDSLTIDGSELAVHIRYGGGCREHSIDLVFWNGFLESDPVQAHAVLAHDARNDPCDAVITRTRRFDLASLRDRFRDAFGGGPGTVIVGVSAPGSTDGLTLEYHF
jgi:hypothetical protein